jgi:hypothetical protein
MDRTIFLDGQFVSERISRVVEAIKEYDPRIEVRWIPSSTREDWQDAFQLIYHGPKGEERMFNVHTEEEFDVRVLHKIMTNDQQKNPLKKSDLEVFDEAARRIMKQAELDAMEEAADKAAFILRTPLHTINMGKDKHGNRHIIRDRGDNI